MSNSLVLHCGAASASREQITQVATPEHTDTWYPIPHVSLFQRIEEALTTMGMRITEEAHALTRDGLRYFGLLKVANGHATSNDYSYVLGLRNSHDMAFKASLAVGSQVFVCDNLAFSGEITIARKHTRFIEQDLPKLCCNAVGQLSNKWTVMTDRIAAYKQAQLTDSTVHDFVIRSLDAGAVTVQQIPAVLGQWRKPNHPEFADRTAWSLFNAYTEVAKSTSLQLLPKRTITLHGLMDSQVGFLGGRPQELTAGTVEADAAEVHVQG
jgi:hypothetical protein